MYLNRLIIQKLKSPNILIAWVPRQTRQTCSDGGGSTHIPIL